MIKSSVIHGNHTRPDIRIRTGPRGCRLFEVVLGPFDGVLRSNPGVVCDSVQSRSAGRRCQPARIPTLPPQPRLNAHTLSPVQRKKPTWENTLRYSTMSAYSSTNPPARPGCSSSSHPTTSLAKPRSIAPRLFHRHNPKPLSRKGNRDPAVATPSKSLRPNPIPLIPPRVGVRRHRLSSGRGFRRDVPFLGGVRGTADNGGRPGRGRRFPGRSAT